MDRDPNLWDDATSFKPERFERTSYKFHLGWELEGTSWAGLAKCTIGLTLGLLIDCFEWERVTKEVDMAQGNGTTIPKAMPFEAMRTTRNLAFSNQNFNDDLKIVANK